MIGDANHVKEKTTQKCLWTAALPRWDMTPIFPSLESAEFTAAYASALTDLTALAALFDKYAVRKRDANAADAEFAAAYDAVTVPLNFLLEKMRLLASYIGCFTTTDANDETAKAAESKTRYGLRFD